MALALACKSACRAGNATLTMKKSRTIMNVPAMRTANADQLPIVSTGARAQFLIACAAAGLRTVVVEAVTEKCSFRCGSVHLTGMLESPPTRESRDSRLPTHAHL